MTAMPTSDRSAFTASNQVMQVQYDYTDKDVLSARQYTAERRSTSPDAQIDIFAGGWDDDADDDDEDYVDMAPVHPQRTRSATHSYSPAQSNSRLHGNSNLANSPSRLLALRAQAPEVVILPASPHGSIASNASQKNTSRSPSPTPSTDDSESSDSDSGEDSDSDGSSDLEKTNEIEAIPQGDITSKQGSKRTSIPSSDAMLSTPPPTPPRRQASLAGQAAKKYLQMHHSQRVTSHFEPSRTGLARSSSRVGTRGVQGRISSKKSLGHATAVRSQSVETLSSSDSRSEHKISEAKQKSRTLDRSLSGVTHLGVDNQHVGQDDPEFDDEDKRQSNDGAAVMKMISDRRRKSQSLDSKYLQYLDGISKHASAPNSPGRNTLEKKNKKSKKKNKKKSKEEDDEEFQKYAEIMATRTRSSFTGSTPELSKIKSDSMERNLAEFAKEKSKADKYAKKKLQTASLASKFSFKKSKTLGKAESEAVNSKNDFAESAQAFHEHLQRENSLPSNFEDISLPVEASPSKSDSFKKEKRKSWRKKHGFSMKSRSKERLNLDPTSPDVIDNGRSPPLTPNGLYTTEDSTGKRRSIDKNSRGPPQIRQSLGYKPSESPKLRPNKLSNGDLSARERSSSTDQGETPTHSPKIMSPATTRSKTLDNRKMGSRGDQIDRLGSAGPRTSLKHMNSLNSENSGSNSDLSLVLDEEFDDLKVGRAGTLSRLLGRKMKAGKTEGMEFEDAEVAGSYSTGSLGRRGNKRGKYATLGSPSMTLRMRHANSRETLLETVQVFDPIDLFFSPKKFVRGFRVTSQEDDGETEGLNDIGIAFESAHVNKYATITAAMTSPFRSNEHAVLKKRASDSKFETSRSVSDASPPIPRRNQSIPAGDVPSKMKSTKGKGFGSTISRTLQKGSPGPSNHLAFSDVLIENEVVVSSSERRSESPLRMRKLQVIEPLLEEPSPKILSAARTLYRRLLATRPDLLRNHSAEDERDNYGVYEHTVPEPDLSVSFSNCVFGQELVAWLIGEMPSAGQESSDSTSNATEARQNICAMLQALLEEGAISHVRREHHFQDSYLLYQFHESVTKPDDGNGGRPMSAVSTLSSSTTSSDVNSTTSLDTNDIESQGEESARQPSRTPSVRSNQTASAERWVPSVVDEQELKEVLSYLQNVAPDSMFRMVLRKLPEDRTAEELMMIYEEILHIKALTHLSDSVKRELAGVLKFEFHRKRGKTLFSQGDEGRSWYIIVKGSVDVDIQGQGVVCTLHEGDDFGNLAIINDAPRAATIVLADDNCQLLRVDKHDFVRILKDVEANTVRLKEHEKDVLILQKIHARSSSTSGRQEKFLNNNTKGNHQRLPAAATPTRNNHRYAISAGTPSKIVEHVVKSLRPWSTAKQSDEAMEDLILMYQVFMSTQELCKYLMHFYQSEKSEQIDSTKSIKRKVVYFVVRWSHIATHIFYDQPAVGPFLKELKQAVQDDDKIYPSLKEDLARIYVPESGSSDSPTHRGWIAVESNMVQRYPLAESTRAPHQAVKTSDDVMLKVFNANGTYTTVKLPVISTVTEVIAAVAEKQGRDVTDLQLIQVQSDGDMYALPKNMTSAATSLGVNSRLFICSTNEKDDISPLPEQQALPTNNSTVLEMVGTQEIAEHITQFDWELINSIHVMEFVHKVFGSHKFNSVTSNIDLFARRFNQLAYWAPTEICSCNNVNKRVHLLRKFIKIAQHLKELQNMNGFMAVMIGLGNQALSRLHGTWDKLPTKYKKLMTEFEAILDPSRNHRAYRLHVAGLRPPLIPYLPLLMKDMTFQHEGNDSMRNGLINFEKMHMMSNSIRGVIQACSKPLEMGHTVITSKTFDETRQYTRTFGVITDQKLLNQLAGKVETKR